MFGFFARTGVAALAVFGACLAQGQSFNVDLDLELGSPAVGVGAPSSSFGAAANQVGTWNKMDATGHGPKPLRDLAGNLTSVLFTGPMGGGANGFNNPQLTGDYALLMKDGRNDPGTWTFGNLIPGRYQLYTYAVYSSGRVATSLITVEGSSTPNPQGVTGPIPPMQFVLGVTHCIHTVDVASGSLTVRADGEIGGFAPYINGFQLVLVPEPGTMLGLSTLTLLLLGRRRRSPTSSGSNGI